MYVLAYAGNSTAPENGIYRANLDGTGVEPVLNLTGSTVLGVPGQSGGPEGLLLRLRHRSSSAAFR